MPATLNLITTTDQYSDANTLQCPNTVRLNLKVFNNGIFLAIGTSAVPTGAQMGNEVFYPPGMYSLDRSINAASVRSADPGSPAIVAMDAWREGEITNG